MSQDSRKGRREFLGVAAGAALASAASARPGSRSAGPPTSALSERQYWVSVAQRLADPVLQNLANGTLKARMPVEEAEGAGRAGVTHLEAFGRLLAGLAPWLELPSETTPEGVLRARYAELAHKALANAVDPASPDALNFAGSGQPLVDAAFLAQALVRAPRTLCAMMDAGVRRNLVTALESTRGTLPAFSNWLLFTAMVEAGLCKLGASWDVVRVEYALRQHAQWYKGDGTYSDGPEFHWDYYNSLVIHPMLTDVLDVCAQRSPVWQAMVPVVRRRAQRQAAILERLISPEGTFPTIGRSLAYRFGAFHLLAQMALRRDLPEGVTPAQVRGALGAVIRRGIEADGTFDSDGWLRIGVCGHQPGIGERYISTGSLYLCAVGLLPLGLAADDPFWSAPDEPWTAKRVWSGQAFPIDHALTED
jgi:hypothetical protein